MILFDIVLRQQFEVFSNNLVQSLHYQCYHGPNNQNCAVMLDVCLSQYSFK